MPDAKEYENNFEKEAYMTINLIRVDPKMFVPHIKDIRSRTFIYKKLISF